MFSDIRGVYQVVRKWLRDRSFEFSDTTRWASIWCADLVRRRSAKSQRNGMLGGRVRDRAVSRCVLQGQEVRSGIQMAPRS